MHSEAAAINSSKMLIADSHLPNWSQQMTLL